MISLILTPIWLGETGQFGGFGQPIENAWKEWSEFGMLIYIHHLQNCLAYWTLSFDFPNLAAIDLVRRVTFGVSRHFLDNTWAEWPAMWHTDVSWSTTEVNKSGHALWIFQILKKSNFVSTGMVAIVARLNLAYVFLFKGRRQCQGE